MPATPALDPHYHGVYDGWRPNHEVSALRLNLRADATVRAAHRFSKLAEETAEEGILPGPGTITLHIGGGRDWGSYKGIWSSFRGLLGVVRNEALYLEEEYQRRGLPIPEKLAAVTAEATRERKSIAWVRAGGWEAEDRRREEEAAAKSLAAGQES